MKCYNPTKINKINKISMIYMIELFIKTFDREMKIRKLGYNIVCIWEHEFDMLLI